MIFLKDYIRRGELRNYRTLSIFLVCFIFLFSVSSTLPASASKIENAETIVTELLSELKVIQKNSVSIEQKKEQFLNLVYGFFDTILISKASTGPYWRTATDDEKIRYTDLFCQLIANITSSQIGDISDFEFTITSSIPKGEEMVLVLGELNAPGNSFEEISIRWRISTPNMDTAKITDIEFENISMLVTQKQENIAIIRKNGGAFSALIEAMEKQLNQ